MIQEIILLILEIIGTIAFAVSGAFVAIKAKLDIFGVVFVGCITAVGGGITRDLLIGVTPPAIFSNLYILLVAVLTSAAVFIIAYIHRRKFDALREKIEHVNNFFDALGLAAFSVMGTEIAFVNGLADNAVLSILLGLLTGVGGGVFRDILTDATPYIFKKHVYALASIGGAALYYGLRLCVEGTLIASIAAMLLIILVRMLAAKYRWSLPKVHLDDE
ncbi:MAG: TRIC cation channel family protein [Clostridia bacterium]|nr:TRIC cation channel family protein [Clostridia bacterium]